MKEEFKTPTTLTVTRALQAQSYSEQYLDKRTDNVNARAMVIQEQIIPMIGKYLYNPCITLKEMAVIIERELEIKTSVSQAKYALDVVNSRPGSNMHAMWVKPDSKTRQQNCYFPNMYIHTYLLAFGAIVEEAKSYDTSEYTKTAKIRITYEGYTKKDVDFAIEKFNKDFSKYFRVTPYKETKILVLDENGKEIYQPGIICLISKTKFYEKHLVSGDFNKLVDATNCYTKLHGIQHTITNLFKSNPNRKIYDIKDIKREIVKNYYLIKDEKDISTTDIKRALDNAHISYRYEVRQPSVLDSKDELIILEDNE
ncbi:MAG: hypothetical protein ACI4V7_09445 [Succinivibrionaceae bacterium]